MTSLTSVRDLPHDAWQRLLDAYPFKPFRHYRTHSRREQTAILATELDRALADIGTVGSVAGEDMSLVAAVARPLAWDTAFFGVPMGRLDVVAATDASRLARTTAIAATIAAARTAGLRHLAARVDVADLETLGVLEDHGFRLMDTLGTYIMRPGKDHPADVRRVGPLRIATPADADAVLAITREAYDGYRNRFHLDPSLPRARADAFYDAWARQCLDGAMADVLMVSEDSTGRVIGYLAFRRREPVSTIGTPIYGGGLGACRRDTPGAYPSLIRDCAVWAHGQGAVAECQTQLANAAVIRVYETVGFHFVRGEHTLHSALA